MNYDTYDMGGDLVDVLDYFNGRNKNYLDAEKLLVDALGLQWIAVSEGSYECTAPMKAALVSHGFASPASHLVVKMRSTVYDKITFSIEYFPGTCAWLVVAPLCEYAEILNKQLYVAEQIAIWTRYGAIMCSHTQDLDYDCVRTLEDHGYKSDRTVTSGNPHSGNTKWLWFKPLAAPLDEYIGTECRSGFYSDTLEHLDDIMREIRCENDVEYDDDHYEW